MSSREFQDRLRRRVRAAGLSLTSDLGARLETYFRLLATWNQRINLTGLNLDEPTPDVLDRLLVEPLAAARHVASGTARLIDIGSGGGSPAIPLALAISPLRIALVEAKTRKSVFLREALRALELDEAEVMTARYEELLVRPELHEAYDLLTVRAVRIEPKVLIGVQSFVRPGGQLFLFRGSSAGHRSELALPPLVWVATYPLVDSLQSRLVVLEKRSARPR